jgi:hypothetical protein
VIEIPRRRFLAGLGLLVAAPAVIRAARLMPVRAVPPLPSAEWRALMPNEFDFAGYEDFLRLTGAGDSPVFLRMLHRIGMSLRDAA